MRNLPADAVRFQLSAQVEGGMACTLAEGLWCGGDTISVPAPALLTADPETNLYTLSATRVRIEMLGGGRQHDCLR